MVTPVCLLGGRYIYWYRLSELLVISFFIHCLNITTFLLRRIYIHLFVKNGLQRLVRGSEGVFIGGMSVANLRLYIFL